MENNGENFYEPVKVNGQTENFVADSNVAQELAEIAKPGIDAALNREQELKEGLTETEKENLQIIEALPGKYPHAFTKETDKEGRPYLIFKGYNHEKDNMDGHLVISQKGLIRIPDERYVDELKRTQGKLTFEFVFNDEYPEHVFIGPTTEKNAYYRIFDLRNTDRESLKKRFNQYEEIHKNDVESKEPTTQELIDSL